MTSVRSWLAGLLSALALLACGRGSEPPEQAAGRAPPVGVSLLHYFSDSLEGGIDELARGFNRQSQRYELKAVSLNHEAFKSSIRDTLKSGNPPDLYSYWAGARTASIVPELEPLDDLWQAAGLDQRFHPALVRAASTYQGRKYLLPLTQHSVVFFYNKQVFAVHKLQPPATWPEFLALCAALKAKGVTPIALGAKDRWPAQFWFDLLLLRTAPHTFRAQLMEGSASYLDPRVRKAFEHWAGLIDKGYFNADANTLSWDHGANQRVFEGQAAMTLMGTWNIGYFSNDAHRWVGGRDFDVFPFPVMDAAVEPVALGPIDGLVLPRNATNIEGAKQVMAYLAGIEPQQAFSRGSGALAPNQQVPPDFYSDIQRRVQAQVNRSPHFAFNYDLATPPEVAEMGLNAFSEFLAFPRAYRRILAKLDRDAQAYFTSVPADPFVARP